MRYWIKYSVVFVAFLLISTCLTAQDNLGVDSTTVDSKKSHGIGIIGSPTEGVGIGYRYWSPNRFGFGVSFTPIYSSKWLYLNAGGSVLYKLSLKGKTRYPYLNLGASYTPILFDNSITGGIGLGYEWVIKDLFQLNLKIDFVYGYENGKFTYPFPVPFPGIAMFLKL